MRVTIRHSTFETNSSSVHAIVILGKESADRLRKGEENIDLREFHDEDDYILDENAGDEAMFIDNNAREQIIWSASEYDGTAPGIYGEPCTSCESEVWSYEAMKEAAKGYNGGDVVSASLSDSADGGLRFEVVYMA